MSGLVNYHNFSLADTPSLIGKVAIVTGGQAGFGKEIVATLLKNHINKVYVLARSTVKYQEAIKYWVEKHSFTEDDLKKKVDFRVCDLSDMKVVKRVADALMRDLQGNRLDMLINNAGLPTVPDYTLSPQNIETIWATNVVGHLELTEILLPILEETAQKHGDSRIVITSSSFHMGCQELKFDLTMSPSRVKSPDAMDSMWRYARSKLGAILFCKELANRLAKRGSDGVYANCFFPGNIPTGAMDTWKELFGTLGGCLMKGTFQVLGQSLEDGAATAIYLATSPDVVKKSQKGKYFIPIAKEDEVSHIAQDKDLAKNLYYWCQDKLAKCLGNDWAEVTSEASAS